MLHFPDSNIHALFIDAVVALHFLLSKRLNLHLWREKNTHILMNILLFVCMWIHIQYLHIYI